MEQGVERTDAGGMGYATVEKQARARVWYGRWRGHRHRRGCTTRGAPQILGYTLSNLKSHVDFLMNNLSIIH